MLEGLAQLLELQRLDDELVAFEREHGGLPLRREQIQTGRVDAETAATAAKATLGEAERQMRAAETALQDGEALRVRLEGQQFQVKTNEAYSALLREIEQAKAAISDCETGILEAMDAIESARSSKSNADRELVEANSRLDEEGSQIDAREVELRELIERHRELRVEIGPKIDTNLLNHYERIAKRRSPAVVVVTRELCTGCRVGIPAQDFIEIIRGETVVTCGNCTRILLHDEKVESEPAP